MSPGSPEIGDRRLLGYRPWRAPPVVLTRDEIPNAEVHMPDDSRSAQVLDTSHEIAAANPITVESGADRDIMLTQHDDTLGEERVIWFDVRHAESVAAAILAQARIARGRR